MSDFWKEFKESDPTRKNAPDSFGWPGLTIMTLLVLYAILKAASLYSL
ncbi:MAG: hypothetical protein ILO34_01440 [Kiritimatiellae bacterium]|nr:hypothetical protein [Kiritimatiellia bacterium]